MSTISWGKITVYERAYRPGAYSSAHQFTALSIPVEGSSQLNITQGESKEAKQEGGELVDKKNAAQRALFKKLKKQGEKNIWYLKSDDMVGHDNEPFVESTHFTDLGMMRYAEWLLPHIKRHMKR